jgi:tRNA (mo5U34)-methyltransferase
LDKETIRREVEKIKWFHTIDLGNGIITPGYDRSSAKLLQIGLPADLIGKSVLDIGAWDGFFSFECEHRNAKRVLATDHFCWSGEEWGTKKGFDLAKKVLNSKVEEKEIDVLELTADKVGTFDVVLFLGVLYHMRYPLVSLERVASVTKGKLILETHIDFISTQRPAIAFYPETELKGDRTNWCGPNKAALIGMLKDVGFKKIQVYSTDSIIYRIKRSIYRKFKYGDSIWETFQQGRMVIHAWK